MLHTHIEAAQGRRKLVVSLLELAHNILVEFFVVNLVVLHAPGVHCLVLGSLC